MTNTMNLRELLHRLMNHPGRTSLRGRHPRAKRCAILVEVLEMRQLMSGSPPVVTTFSDTTLHDQTLAIGSDFLNNYSDPESDPLASVTILSLPAQGTLVLNGTDIIAGQIIAAADVSSLQYVPLPATIGSVAFDWTASDGTSNATASATANIAITDQAPTLTDAAQSLNHDTTLTFVASEFTSSFADPDSGDQLQSITIDTLPGNGQLTLVNGTNSSAVTAGEVITASNLGDLRYTPNFAFTGTDAFLWNASDGILNAQTDSNFTLTISETAPVLSDVSISIHPGGAFAFSAATFAPGFSDANSLQSLTLVTLPAHGVLTLGNLPVSTNQVIPLNQLSTLSYRPLAGYGGNDVFLWNASDGLDVAASPAALRINQGEHAPTITSFSQLVPENGSVTLSAVNFTSGFADQDVSDSFQSVTISALPTHGVLRLNNSGTLSAVTANQSIAVSQLGNLVYTPTAGFHGTDTFKWRGSDGTLLSSPAITTLNINAFQLTGNSVVILQGDATPRAGDFTDFRFNSVNAPAVVTRTYTITNIGAASLTLTGNAPVTVSGANAADFTITAQPASTTLVAGGNTTFTISFHPEGGGVRNATVSIANALGGNAPFTFAVRGTGMSTSHVNINNAQLATASSMDVATTVAGQGAGAINGQIMHMTYTGYLLTGSVFDATANHGNIPFVVRIDNDFTDGNLYAASGAANTIQKFPLGTGTAFASSSLANPQGMAFDGLGNLYVANSGNNTIEKFTPSGNASVFASTGLNHPTGIAFDAFGNLYVANSGNNTIEKLTATGNATVFASSGLNNPQGLAVDFAGNVFAANSGNNTIEKFTQSTGTNGALTVTASVFAANDTSGSLNAPVGLAFDTSGSLYAANSGANTIEKFVQSTGTNGSLTVTSSVFNSTGLSSPQGLAFDASGALYAANAGDNTIEKYTIDSQTGAVTATTFATTAAAPSGLAFNVNQPYISNNVSNRLADTPVIQGWEYGLQGIKVGETRVLIIPAAVGYGDTGSPPNIPGGATLIFEVTCNAIDPTPSLGTAYVNTQSAILPGDVTPNTLDGTDFGTLSAGQTSSVHTYYLFDDGADGFTGNLTKFVSITGAGFTGPAAADFAITGHSGVGFDVTFTPKKGGTRSAIAHIVTNNPVRPDFSFAVTGSAASITDLALAFGKTTFPAGGIVSGSGTNLTLPLVIGNLGTTAVPSTTPTTDIQIYAHNNGTNADTLLLNIPAQQVAGLGAGASKSVNLSVAVPASIVSGNYSIKAVINSSRSIIESNAANDSATTSNFTIAQGFFNLNGNLVSDTIPANSVSGPIALKGNVTLSVKNAGNLVLPAGQKVTLQIIAHSTSSGNTTLTTSAPISVAGLKPGLSANITVPVNFLAGLPADTYQIEAVIGTTPLLPETNTGDNTITTTASSGVLSFTTVNPDIAATLGNSTIPGNILGGASSNITYSGNLQVVVANAGSIALPSGEQVTVQVRAHNGSGDVILVGTSSKFSVSSLAAGHSSTISVPVKFLGSLLAAGSYTLQAYVSPVPALTEVGTGNNLATVNASSNSLTLVVTPGAFNIEGFVASGTPALPTALAANAALAGQIKVTVENNGNLVLPAGQQITIQVFAHNTASGNTTSGDPVIGATTVAQSVAGLAVNGTKTIAITMSFPAGLAAGNYEYWAQISTVPPLTVSDSSELLATGGLTGTPISLVVT